ncbi:uncharacterized protein LOC103515649 [Diaphorina citri]|uniref:Uncharacterized protein LOC103515649 n=1 Tax=Diaphorina citri TaxID=121845 RepID=A0A1S4EJ75_DIACI|nr:uncharacterized protein LOC103515649 [Diaphorina citri]KAI5702504.1 hypothetical protein M8J75_000811 [Diaphorina citri]KAI5732995.1 hypothetical protein M8J76_006504 [Diaphorina citri]KAI5739599.1 hypothetical protein M8J77_021239 [Diaphorina citri]
MDQENNPVQKLTSMVTPKRTLKTQCMLDPTEKEVTPELEDLVKTYDANVDSIQYHLTHVPSKGILKRSSYFQQSAVKFTSNEDKSDVLPATKSSTPEDNFTDEEEPPHIFPTVKDSLEILLKKKSSISARKSILKNPSKTSNITTASIDVQLSDDDEISAITKFPAKDSMEILIKKSKSCLKVSEPGEGTFDKGDEMNKNIDQIENIKDTITSSDDEEIAIIDQDFDKTVRN